MEQGGRGSVNIAKNKFFWKVWSGIQWDWIEVEIVKVDNFGSSNESGSKQIRFEMVKIDEVESIHWK